MMTTPTPTSLRKTRDAIKAVLDTYPNPLDLDGLAFEILVAVAKNLEPEPFDVEAIRE